MKQSNSKKHFSLRGRLALGLAACLYYSGLIALARWWTCLSGKKLVVLCYRHAADGALLEHILYLKRHYRILHLEDALAELYQPGKEPRSTRDRRTMLALTFDDGYHDHYTYGLPLASSLQVPMTVFLLPGYVESGRRFWWREPDYLVRNAQTAEATIRGHTYHVQDPQERQRLLRVLYDGLRLAPSFVQRESFLAEAYKALAVPFSPDRAQQEPGMCSLNWEEARAMERDGWVSFGAHTMNHPTLAALDDAAEAQYEVSECRTELEKQLGHAVRVFAYPPGKRADCAGQSLQAVKHAAYPWAVTTIRGVNTARTDPHLLHRMVVDVDQHWLQVAARASGW